MLAPLLSPSITDKDKSAIKILIESYENDSSKSIEDFFENNNILDEFYDR
jgi:hypothetical protein